MLPAEAFQDLGHSFLLYGPPSRQRTYTAVSRKVALRDNVASYYGQWWFYVVEGHSTNTCIHAFPFLIAKSP